MIKMTQRVEMKEIVQNITFNQEKRYGLVQLLMYYLKAFIAYA
jgi:16S rRNA G966 N2-methylase RsmD